MKKGILIFFLIFPIAVLLFITLSARNTLQNGLDYELSISGFDPIDPLSGHFVTYRIDYGLNPCEIPETECLCFEPNPIRISIPETCSTESCTSLLRGKCEMGRFRAGIEKYFIPEDRAKEIDEIVQRGKSKIIITIKEDKALVKDLILGE